MPDSSIPVWCHGNGGKIHSYFWKIRHHTKDRILYSVEMWDDGIVGAISYLKLENEFLSVKDKLGNRVRGNPSLV